MVTMTQNETSQCIHALLLQDNGGRDADEASGWLFPGAPPVLEPPPSACVMERLTGNQLGNQFVLLTPTRGLTRPGAPGSVRQC